jgi:Transposase DDE domain
MIGQATLLVTLVRLVDRAPAPPPPAKRGRGRPETYPDRLFLKALVVMIVRHLHSPNDLVAVLAQPTAEMAALRALLTLPDGRAPSRRTWERRPAALPDTRPAPIGCLGQHLVALLRPWAACGRAAAIDSTVLRARGGGWHTKHREAGDVPHTAMDTEAHGTKSGWHGWVDGWTLHLCVTVAAVWIPLAARLTPANEADNELAPALLAELPAEARFVLGDRHYNTEEVRAACAQADRVLVTSQYGGYPHADDGVEVRRVFHKLRSAAIENFNGQFKAIFDVQGAVPTKGLAATRRFALGAILVYQLTLWHRHEHGLDLRVGLDPFLKAA